MESKARLAHRMKTNRHIRAGRLSLCILGMAIVIATGCGMYAQTDKAAADELISKVTQDYEYATVIIPEGATVWSIAADINDGDMDTRDIVNIIAERNSIGSDYTIIAGECIEIPVVW
jgi:hypothetical protein